MGEREDRRFHDLMNFVGIRAPLTTAAVLQLVRELHRSGVLDDGAVERIKGAVIREAALFRKPHLSKEEFRASMGEQLDRLIAGVDAGDDGPI